jgi:Flp pilus assembly pilin Flp
MMKRRPQQSDAVEYGILIGSLALGLVLTLLAIGTQIRTVVTDSPPNRTGEP